MRTFLALTALAVLTVSSGCQTMAPTGGGFAQGSARSTVLQGRGGGLINDVRQAIARRQAGRSQQAPQQEIMQASYQSPMPGSPEGQLCGYTEGYGCGSGDCYDPSYACGYGGAGNCGCECGSCSDCCCEPGCCCEPDCCCDTGCGDCCCDGSCGPGPCPLCTAQGPAWCGFCHRYGCGCGCGGCEQGFVNGAVNAACCCQSGDQRYNFAPGPPAAQTTYPYYTVRGPRDFLLSNPQPLGPY